jgi:hypothetical protein
MACHKYGFADLVTGIHTQNFESCNNKLKRGIKNMNGLDQGFSNCGARDFFYWYAKKFEK